MKNDEHTNDDNSEIEPLNWMDIVLGRVTFDGWPLKEAIYQIVRAKRGGITLAELRDILGERAKGTAEICDAFDEHLILWKGASREFAEAFCDLLSEGTITLRPAPPFVYIMDGCVLTLPIAKQPPISGYKTDHWMPVLICPARPALEEESLSSVCSGQS